MLTGVLYLYTAWLLCCLSYNRWHTRAKRCGTSNIEARFLYALDKRKCTKATKDVKIQIEEINRKYMVHTNSDDIWNNRDFRWFMLYNIDKCSICHHHFSAPTEKSFIGLDENGISQHVCYSCQMHLNNAQVWEKHSWPFEIPEADASLWEYMDLARFLSLLDSSSLFFKRLDKFNDKYEGVIASKEGIDHTDGNLNFSARIKAFIKSSYLKSDEIPEEEYGQLISQEIKEMKSQRTLKRRTTFVNCWSENESESEAMWRLYSKDMKCGIAIRTTYEKLFKSINSDYIVDIGRVHYVNYDKDFYAGQNPVWYKRKSLDYEREVRAVITSNCKKSSLLVPVDLRALIEDVVTSPEAEEWFAKLVQRICVKYGIDCNVKQSEIQTKIYI